MSKITLESKIVNDNYTQFLYDSYDIQDKEKTVTEVPTPSKEDMEEMNKDNWNILLICGKSGSGKSTILREIYGDVKPIEYDHDKCVISQFPRLSEEETCDLLSSIGLASVPTWLRKPQELSNGERARLDIAKAIYDANGGIVVLDEYTSVVNRSAAKSMSFALQRYARQKDLKIIIASCHFDIIEWLQPDYVFNLEHRDENGNVEMEKMIYNDDTNYNVYQSPREIDILTEAIEIPKKYKSLKDYYTVAMDKNLILDYDGSFGDYATYSDHVLSQTRIDEMLEYINSINETIYTNASIPSSYYVVSQPVANYFTTSLTSAY